jgi:iron complex outermembrane receptor protein
MALRAHAMAIGCLAAGAVLVAAPPGWAAPRLNIPPSAMAEALAELARYEGVEILFDARLVAGLTSKPVRGELTAQAALSQLLAGSPVGFRTKSDGVIILFASSQSAAADREPTAVSEILVTGHRTQNADIQRTANDIQPYQVWNQGGIATASRDNLDQFLRSYEPSNAQNRPPSEDPEQFGGSTNSAVDLRGFGTEATLVLVDGRRMPHLPSTQGEFTQPDLNGIPLGAIERLEILTSTSGGIYGPSAIGGVVNVILRRDYRGAELTLTSGISTRGDAGQARLEGRIGFTPDQGQTDVMLMVSRSVNDPLLFGQRDYQQRERALKYANDPAAYVATRPTGKGVSVYSLDGGPLTLAPQFGGTQLSSGFTYLPLNFIGSDAARAAALVANSGQLAPGLPNDRGGDLAYAVANPTVTSALLSVRRRLSGSAEFYLDGLYFENAGLAELTALPMRPTLAGAPGNPFAQSVFLTFPLPAQSGTADNTVRTGRLSAGFVASLPLRNWTAAGDFTLGGATNRVVVDTFGATQLLSANVPGANFFDALASGAPSPDGRPALMPLGDWPAFMAASATYLSAERVTVPLTNRFSDASLRFGGPIARLAGGDLTATFLLETRREEVTAGSVIDNGVDIGLVLPRRREAVQSGYVEFRAPLGPADAGNMLLRGLELQLALRYDRTTTTLPDNAVPGAATNDRLISLRRDAPAVTVGARMAPVPAILLRGSFATGELPPTISQLQQADSSVFGRDPRRGNQLIGVGAPAVLMSGGSHDVKQASARTITLGVVFNPSGRSGPRVSLDYSHTTLTGEVEPFSLTAAQLLAAEAANPGRVVRAPLTTADAAAGFTAGPIIQLDTRNANSGRAVADAVDAQLGWLLEAGAGGRFRVHGAATWEPNFSRRLAPGQPTFNRVGYNDGPLAWRGNLGVEWIYGANAIDVDAQYFDRYRITVADPTSEFFPENAQQNAFLGRTWIPSQTYVDLAASRRIALRGPGGGPIDVQVRLAIQNIFDASPPIVVDLFAPGYSPYGDPRRRRVVLTFASHF